jgi:hypothetical protein
MATIDKWRPNEEKKLLKRFSEIGTYKEKLTPTDGRTDDGQVGIRKAPLPDGTAELKTSYDDLLNKHIIYTVRCQMLC